MAGIDQTKSLGPASCQCHEGALAHTWSNMCISSILVSVTAYILVIGLFSGIDACLEMAAKSSSDDRKAKHHTSCKTEIVVAGQNLMMCH